MDGSVLVPWIGAHAVFLGALLVRNLLSRVLGV